MTSPAVRKPVLRAAVIGHPIGHSLSPVIHRHWLRHYGIAGAFERFDVAPEELGGWMAAMAGKRLAGISVTLPHKETVMAFLDHVDDRARTIGAVNLVVAGAHGLEGRNTDGYGFLAHLNDACPGWPSARPALVLGAGGAARAVIAALAEARVPEIRIANRSRGRLAGLIEDFGTAPVKACPWPPGGDGLEEVGLLVNTTALGMSGAPALAVDLRPLAEDAVVYDIVYQPLRTALLKSAAARGLRTVDGLGMLMHQAAPAFEAFFGVLPKVDTALRDVVLEAVRP